MKYSLTQGLLTGSITLNILAAGFFIFSDTDESNNTTALTANDTANKSSFSEQSQSTREDSANSIKGAHPIETKNNGLSSRTGSSKTRDEDGYEDDDEDSYSSENPYLTQSRPSLRESEVDEGLQPSTLSTEEFEQLIKSNPKAVTAIKLEQTMRTHIEYQGFFNEHAMDNATKQRVLQALTERNLTDFEIDSSDEEAMRRAYEQHQQHIAELLGPELNQKLETYEHMQESRWTLMDVKQQLSSDNQTFDLQKERHLAHIISETKDQALNELDSSGAWDSDQGYAEAYQQHIKQAHEIILEKAQYDLKLTQEELLALKRSLEYERLQSLTTDLITNTLFSE